LNKGDILVLDNLSCHKAYNEACLKPLIDKGVEILWLPPYSSDFNPIELSWSKLKTIIKRHKPRAVDELMRVLKTALEEITKKDIINWFKHDGYVSIIAL
jgi:transposase